MPQKCECVIIIPARYDSARFPGKPLKMLGGRSVLERVYSTACKVTAYVYVATDDKRVERAVKGFSGNVIMSQKRHRNGSERVFEAYSLLYKKGLRPDYIVNLQADEPLVKEKDLRLLLDECKARKAQIATLAAPFLSMAEAKSADSVKVVANYKGEAVYFSRALIPYQNSQTGETKPNKASYKKHVGVYVFSKKVVPAMMKLSPSSLEKIEGLEQLRWVEAGYPIALAHTSTSVVGINSPGDLEKAEKLINKNLCSTKKNS